MEGTVYMRRKAFFLIFCICSGMLAGCEKTPEDTIVKKKGAESIREYQSTEHMGSALYKNLGVPKRYKNQSVYENGRLVIDTDADVLVPDVENISTYSVSAKNADQKMIDFVTDVFFPDAKFYHSEDYNTLTKEECQQKITELKKYQADANLDPYHYGKDKNGDYYFNLESRIAYYEENLKNAPNEKSMEEICPSFGLDYPVYDDNNMLKKEILEDFFYGTAEAKDGIYNYSISNGKPDLEFKIEKQWDHQIGLFEPVYEITGEQIMDSGDCTDHMWTKDEIEKYIHISYEDAEKIVLEKINNLDMNFTVYGWDYNLFYHGTEIMSESNILDGGYIFYFSREVDNVPITYTSIWGGGLEDIDSTLEPWRYERCIVIVGSDGIRGVELQNPYEIGQIQTQNVKMMDFDSMIRIYEQMMEISHSDLPIDEKLRMYHIRKITLGYCRIYDPTVNNTAGLLVPVWDFFGEFDLDSENESYQNSGEHSIRSLLTINAIDGTVIDRELGY